jgi:hypothetical protein
MAGSTATAPPVPPKDMTTPSTPKGRSPSISSTPVSTDFHQRSQSLPADIKEINVAPIPITSTPQDLIGGKPTPVLVCVRVRPATIAEVARKDGKDVCVDVLKSTTQIRIKNPVTKDPRSATKEFTFDAVFGSDESQKRVYDSTIRTLIGKCVQGYNGCVFGEWRARFVLRVS